MATRARHTEEIEFHDGTKVTLRPLTIKNLRVFMAMLEDVRKSIEADEADAEADDADEAAGLDELGMLGKFIEIAKFSLNSQRKEEVTTEELEELVDMPTVQDILRICGGVELGNQTAATMGNPLGRR